MIAIQAIDYNIMEKAIVYHFNVLYDEQNWVISKEYVDFVELQEDLASVYSPDQLPYLTGEVRPWARLSADTGTKKLPKLENYLIEAVTTNFEPQLFTVTIPSISDPTKVLRINKSLFDFLDFATHYRPKTPPGSPSAQSPDTTDQPPTIDEDGNVVPQRSPEAPPKPAGPTKEEIQRKEREDEKYQLEAQAKEFKRRIDNSNSTVTTITSQVRCSFENFSIIERDRIDYEIKVGMWGHTWTVEKRYSEFEALHQGMLDIYGTEDANGRGKGVPNFEDSKVPFFRKLEVGTAKSRQRFFRTYFHDLLRIIDTLEPQGLIAGFEIIINDADGGAPSGHPINSPNSKGGDRRVKVAINKFIFDFLNFQENLDRMTRANANTADKLENIGKVSKEIQEAMVDREKAEKRLKVIRALERRKKTRKPTPDQVVDELADYIPTIQDDVDVLNAIRYFVHNGTVLRDVQHLAKLYPPNASGESNSLVSTLLGQDGGRVVNSPLAVPLAGELAGTAITFKMGAKGQGATPARGGGAAQRKPRGKSSFGTTSATGEEGFYTDGEDDDDYDFIDVDHDSGAVFSTSVLKRNATTPIAAAVKVKSLPPKTPTRPIKPDTPAATTTTAPTPSSKVATTTVGITSLQATRIASTIYFNDTRRDAITILAEALCDDSDWDALFGTLIYYWAECRSDAERVIAEAVAVPSA